MARRESFEEMRARSLRQEEAGRALAAARWERGQRLDATERVALTRWSLFGSDGYPIRRLGRGWTIDHPKTSFPIMRTKAEAVVRWETLLDCWRDLEGREAQERQVAAQRCNVTDGCPGPLRMLHDEGHTWAPGERPILICCTCGEEQEHR